MGHAQHSLAHCASQPLDRVLYSGLGILLLSTIFVATGLSSSHSSALEYSTSTTAAVHVSSTCSMSTNPSGTDSPHTTTLVNGGYNNTGIGITTIKTLCNDASGYAIYAVGFTGDSIGGTSLHNSADGSSTTNDIVTGTTLNGQVSNWAMKVASGTNGPAIQSDTSGSFANFHTVPDSFTPVAKYTSGVVPAAGSIMTTTYGASISPSQPAGTYVGKVKYVLVHPSTFAPGTYTIAYNANGGSGTMASETGVLNYESHQLANNTFTAPAGTIFGGWCTSNASMYDCTSGMSYANQQQVASLGDAGSTVTLYAYWLPKRPMQTFSCSDMSVGESDYLYDTRDNNIYLVGKLADNNCWMLDNLRLDPTDSTTAANMTSSNTNAPAAAITNYLNGSSTAPQSGWSTTAVFNSATNAWTNYYDVPEINIAFGSNTKDSVVPAHYGAGSGKRGTYYNFCAATAGTYCWASGAGKDLPDTIVDAPYDICPAGWHMPTGGVRKNDTEQVDTGEIGDYQTLCNILNGPNCTNGMSMTATNQNSLQYKLGLPLSGFLYSDSQFNYGSFGDWWSSTYYNGNHMYYLAVNSGNVWPMNYGNRYYGFTMRCVAGS